MENIPPNIHILRIESEYRFADYKYEAEKKRNPPRFPLRKEEN